jgi:hypothetical protein
MVKAERVYDFDSLKSPGQFMFYMESGGTGHGGILFCCPCGCGVVSGVPFSGDRAKWSWNGSEEKPSLTPSILKTTPNICTWHGYLTNGEWITC